MVNGDGGWWGVGAQAGGRMQRSRTWRDDRTHPASVEREQVPTPSGRRPAASESSRRRRRRRRRGRADGRAGVGVASPARSAPAQGVGPPTARAIKPPCQESSTSAGAVHGLVAPTRRRQGGWLQPPHPPHPPCRPRPSAGRFHPPSAGAAPSASLMRRSALERTAAAAAAAGASAAPRRAGVTPHLT